MLKKIPIVAAPIRVCDMISPFKRRVTRMNPREEFSIAFADYLQAKRVFLLNSGTGSVFFILKALMRISDKKEVILPAYTASSLMIAIRKSGLTPVLCDISLRDFNTDVPLLANAVSSNTLCIIGVHLFGIVSQACKEAKQAFPGVFVIEDCAQGLGSRIDGRPVGNLADASIFSFNRGKNLSTYQGGCIATSNGELIKQLEDILKDLPQENGVARFFLPLKIMALSLVVKPLLYGVSSFLISRLKEHPPHADFDVKGYTSFQAAVALSVFKRIDAYSQKRYLNAMRLREGLKDIDGIMVPEISENTKPAFNRFPLVFRDLKRRDRVKKKLWKSGIDSSVKYMRPLHHIFDLGYKKTDFPNAVYLSDHLLTLPAHPNVKEEDIDLMIEVIRCFP